MKKIIYDFALALSVTLLALAVTSCKKNSEPADPSQDEIEKRWPATLNTESGVFVKIQRNITEDFIMGSDNGEPSERPIHKIRFSKSYYMASTEVTQKLWTEIMGSNPSDDLNKGDNNPVDNVNYKQISDFISKLNAKTGRTFRLPTEAEWEYAARGGVQSKGFLYAGSDNIEEVAWFAGNSEDKSHPVGSKAANELGLYDMSGNVAEICVDKMEPYKPGEQLDPKGAVASPYVVRGGSFENEASYLRTTARSSISSSDKFYSYGFRLVLNEPLKEELIN